LISKYPVQWTKLKGLKPLFWTHERSVVDAMV
jgi:hypothetical protein